MGEQKAEKMKLVEIDGVFFFFFLIQQFITQSVVADHGSYFVTTYMETETT